MANIKPKIYDAANRFPMIEDVRRRAIARLPDAISSYLESGTGYETCILRNRVAFDDVIFAPCYIRPDQMPCLETKLFGQDLMVPFGIAPLGMADIVWAGTEAILRQTAARHRFPFVLSMFGSITIEEAARDNDGLRWLQIYPLRDQNIIDDIVSRAERVGYDVLVLTIDCPTVGRRETMRRAGFALPSPRLSEPGFFMSCLLHPRWMLRMLRLGIRFCPSLEPYAKEATWQGVNAFIRSQMPVAMDWEGLRRIRKRWSGHLVVKGIVNAQEARKLAALNIDAVWVSNHGGRQLDAVSSSLEALRTVRAAVDKNLPLLFDSGVRSGLDVVRAMSLGADFVFLGRPFLYGTAAFGEEGGNIVVDILIDEISNTLKLLGVEHLSEIPEPIGSYLYDLTIGRSGVGKAYSDLKV